MAPVIRTAEMTQENAAGHYTFVNTVAFDGDDTSQAFMLPPGAKAMSLQAVGTFDSGTLALQASNDGVTYAALTTAVALTSAGMKGVATADMGYKFYKMVVSGGGGTCALFGYVHVLTE